MRRLLLKTSSYAIFLVDFRVGRTLPVVTDCLLLREDAATAAITLR